jgi:single-stranded DNA-binding protein
LTGDPELWYTPQGMVVCDFSLADNRKFSRRNGEKVEEVAFVDTLSGRATGDTLTPSFEHAPPTGA